MKKIICLSNILALLFSQAGCVGFNSKKQEEKACFLYATQEIKQQLAEKLLGETGTIPADYFETINYMPLMKQMMDKGPSVFGEKEEQQVFWYYLMRLRMLIMYYTYPRGVDDWGILVEYLDMLSGPAHQFIEQHPKEGRDVFASVIAYEEKYPYNPQKGIDEKRAELTTMTREQAAKEFGVPLDELNKLSDEKFNRQLQVAIEDLEDIPEQFSHVREKILQAFKNDLEQMTSGLSPEEYATKKKAEKGITEYTIYMQAPKLHPAELFFAEFVLDPNNDDVRYGFRKLFFSNDGVGGTRIENEKPLPHKVDMMWYSIVENKVYSLQADLPYDTIKEKLIVPEKDAFLGLLFTVGPSGKVDLYVYNTISGEKELLTSFQAKETELSLDDFRQAGTLYENAENPAKDWTEYQQKALKHFPQAANLLAE